MTLSDSGKKINFCNKKNHNLIMFPFVFGRIALMVIFLILYFQTILSPLLKLLSVFQELQFNLHNYCLVLLLPLVNGRLREERD